MAGCAHAADDPPAANPPSSDAPAPSEDRSAEAPPLEQRVGAPGQFTNPLFSNGADPWLSYYEGNYYVTTTTWTSQLVMRKSPTLAGLATAAPVYIWSDTEPSRCCNFWAFEFHNLNGPNGRRWYVIYTAGISANLDGQRTHILESEGSNPMGPYRFMGTLMPGRWNIDGTYLQHDGQLFFLWSEWQGPDQVIWASRMSNPWTLTGRKEIIARPTRPWERQGANVNEAPQIIQRSGRTFMTFSASSCNTPDYKLGLMELTGSDPVNPSSWSKRPSPVFQQANGVYGPGHNGFFKSPDGTEDWLAYHGNASRSQGCGDTRALRAQKISWSADGSPSFGAPVASRTSLAVPSGESGPIKAKVQGAAVRLVNAGSGQCLAAEGADAVQGACASPNTEWTLDPTADGYHRIANRGSGEFLGLAECGASGGSGVAPQEWRGSTCQQWRVLPGPDGWLRLANRETGMVLQAPGCDAAAGGSVNQGRDTSSACQRWRIQPVDHVAIMSAQSGKAVEVGGCSTRPGANVHQWAWLDTPCQKWTFQHVDSGYYQLRPAHNGGACLSVAGGSTSAGGNLVQGACSGSESHWRLEPQPDGSMRLVTRRSGLTMDVANCSIANGANLNQYTWLDNTCQRFHLRQVD